MARADAPVAAQRGVDRAGQRGRAPLDERDVLAVDVARLQRRLQRAQHRVALGDDEQPARVAVQAVHDAGAHRIAAGGPAGERLDERPALVPGGRVHDDPCRLVHDEQVLVLPDDLVRGGRAVAEVHGLPDVAVVDVEDLAATDLVALAGGGPVDEHLARRDEALRAGPRPEVPGEQRVEPLALLLRRDAEAHCPAP